ncbi:hypothetical protein DRQ25_04710 [Candidatus Fermentibacteria bacterium]|nr:MAG: hypothetical protein DRQ25_04710 [Candidatus Fermentibacteria bacterium]
MERLYELAEKQKQKRLDEAVEDIRRGLEEEKAQTELMVKEVEQGVLEERYEDEQETVGLISTIRGRLNWV